MSERNLLPFELQFVRETLGAECRDVNIRLREGEHQYILAKAIASFELELRFPDVRDLIRRLYGEERANDLQFVRKVQTVLKKMEKSGIVKILPKKKPWELQKYALSTFRFRDSDKSLVSFTTDEQIKQTENLLSSALRQQKVIRKMSFAKTGVLVVAIALSYAAVPWALFQPVVNPLIFVSSLSISIIFSLTLGRALSKS